MKYTIWVIPPEPLSNKLTTVIDRLCKEYQGPLFDPHMSLLTNIEKEPSEIEEKVRKWAEDLDKFELSLGPVSFSTTYFQSVFVRVNSTATLMQLNLDAKKLFEMNNDVFMPHMSLLYGNHDMVTREKAAKSVNLEPTSFIVDKFVITPSTNDPKEWEHIATIPLGK